MYKFSKANDPNQILGNSTNTNFIELLKSKWDYIHDETDVFKYKIGSIPERIVDAKYLVQLNPNRASQRRAPVNIQNVCQPFDESQFHFNKINPKEVLFNLGKSENNIHTLIVNVSPITRYHTLLCPSLSKNLPQMVTEESIAVALDIMFFANHRDLRIGYNSLCALASVNHLHYHIFLEPNKLPVEIVRCRVLKDPLFCIENYPVPAFCFQVKTRSSVTNISRQIFRLLTFFLSKCIAHNIFITRGEEIPVYCLNNKKNGDKNDVIRVIVWPRKSSAGVKQLNSFNVAVCELSGWFPVYDKSDFDKLTTERLENELNRWKYDDFSGLCKEVESLYA